MKRTILLLQVFMLSAFMLSAQTTYLPFTESFEYGIEKWTDGTTGGTVEVTATQSVVGTQSFHMTGTATASKLTNSFSNAIAVNEIMYYIRVAGTGGAVAIFGDGTNNLFYGEVNGGNFVVVDINGAYAIAPVTINEWLKVEVKNINYTTYTYEVWINDTLRRSGLEFNSSISGISQIDLYNTTTTHEAWWDAIYAGVVDYNKPTYTGENVCLGDTANLVFSDDVAFDSLGINITGTNFSIGPINIDTTVYYAHPYIQSEIVSNNGYGLPWGGNMFDITAEKDISIYAFDINPDDGTGIEYMKIYYRKGTYVGNNTSNVGWLLHDSVPFTHNPSGGLCQVELSRNLTIPKGETYGIYMCYENGPNYTNGTVTNETVINEHMKLDLGVGGAYFNVSFNQRIWNGRIYYQVVEEQIDTEEFITSHTGTSGLSGAYGGNMFDIEAKNDIILDSLDVRTYTAGNGWVKVYYRKGTYVGNNTSNVGWTLLDSVNVNCLATPALTRVALKNKLLIPAGEVYGIYVCTEHSVRYANSGLTTYQDSNMVFTGAHGGGYFGVSITPRIWNGTIYYTVRNNEEASFGPQTSPYTGTVRGYCFVAPKDFIIKGVMVPNDVVGDQCIEILRFSDSLPPPYSSVTNEFTSLGYWKNLPQGVVIPCDIYVNKGDYMGVYGKGGNTTSYCSSASTMDILGETVDIFRSGMQFDLLTEQMHDVFSSTSADKGRVNLYVEDISKHGGQDSVLIDMHSPSVYLGTDTAICASETINLDAGTFSTYNWSSGGFAQVEAIDSIGTGIGSTDVWVVVADQYGCEATDTITITFNDCTGIEEEKFLLSVYPNPSKDVFFVSAEGLNDDIYIDVIGMDGRIIKQIVSSDNLTKIDLSTQEPGVYFIRLTIGDQVQVVNVVLQ